MEEGLIMERLAGRLRRGDGRGSTIFFFGLLGAGALLAIGLAPIASGLDVPLARMAIAAVPPDTPLFQLLTYLSGTPEAKGMIPAAALFWVLFTRLEDSIAVRWARTLAVLSTGLAAIVLGRLFANVMPFRPRPLASPEVMGAHVQTSPFLADFSSMPSDHAMIFVALAVAAFFVSRALGAVLLAHAVLLVSLPRVLLGIHYPSDVLVGGGVGGHGGPDRRTPSSGMVRDMVGAPSAPVPAPRPDGAVAVRCRVPVRDHVRQPAPGRPDGRRGLRVTALRPPAPPVPRWPRCPS